MPDTDGSDSFASVLLAIKDRTGDSYETLARRVGIASSTLHRYCAGRTLPAEFSVVERLGRACDASRAELIALHQAWAATAAARSAAAEAQVRPEQVAAEQVAPEPVADEPVADEQAVPPGPARLVAPAPPGRAATPALRRLLATARRPAPYAPTSEPATILRNWALLLIVGLLVLTAGAWRPGGGSAGANELADPSAAQQVLLLPDCDGTLTIGRQGQCVVELQRRLAANNLAVESSGSYDESTQRRVFAFQELAGLPVTGAVDPDTKKRLYGQPVKDKPWESDKVERAIRAMFPEDAEAALRLAMCESRLDPLWVNSNPRSWGVFGLTDAMLEAAGYRPRDALDPRRNIQIARLMWDTDHGFHDWPMCGQLPYDQQPI